MLIIAHYHDIIRYLGLLGDIVICIVAFRYIVIYGYHYTFFTAFEVQFSQKLDEKYPCIDICGLYIDIYTVSSAFRYGIDQIVYQFFPRVVFRQYLITVGIMLKRTLYIIIL